MIELDELKVAILMFPLDEKENLKLGVFANF